MATIIRLNFSAYLPPDYPATEQQTLAAFGKYLFWPAATAAKRAAAGADDLIVLTNSNTPSSLLEELPLPRIKLLIHPNSGYDNLAADFVRQANFDIILGHALRAPAVTEFILACVGQAYTPIPWRTAWDQQRSFPGRELIEAQHFLLSGFGHIGQRVAQILTGLGALVEVVDPFAQDRLTQAARHNPLLHPRAWPDINWGEISSIILAASLNPTSWHQINPEIVPKLGPRVTLINAARGPLIDPAALQLFLQGEQHHAFIDTWENEPRPLFDWHHPRLHASSHVAGVYPTLGKRMLDYTAQVISDFQKLDRANFQQKYQAECLQHRLRQDSQGQTYLI